MTIEGALGHDRRAADPQTGLIRVGDREGRIVVARGNGQAVAVFLPAGADRVDHPGLISQTDPDRLALAFQHQADGVGGARHQRQAVLLHTMEFAVGVSDRNPLGLVARIKIAVVVDEEHPLIVGRQRGPRGYHAIAGVMMRQPFVGADEHPVMAQKLAVLQQFSPVPLIDAAPDVFEVGPVQMVVHLPPVDAEIDRNGACVRRVGRSGHFSSYL